MSAPKDKRQLQARAEEREARKASTETYDAPWVGYVNVDLTEAQKREFLAWYGDRGFWTALDDAVKAGVSGVCEVPTQRTVLHGLVLAQGETQPECGTVRHGTSERPRNSHGTSALSRVLAGGPNEAWSRPNKAFDDDRW